MKIVTAIILTFSVWLGVFSMDAHAQDFGDDPLMKPEIWHKLESSPKDDYLWMLYFGKDLFDLNPNEYQMYEQLKGKLNTRDHQSAATSAFSKNIQAEQVLGEEYEFLVQNVTRNFGMIEMFFTEKFEALGSEYVPYNELYPNKNYNLNKWVDEHETRLVELHKLNAQNGMGWK